MMNEYIFNYTLPLLGKHSILPVLYSARKAHEYLGGDINFSAWINDINDSDAMRYKRNIIDFYTNELNCNQSTAKNLFDLITFDFSINKESKNKENSRIIKTLRKVFFESRYRIPYYITKTKYLRFFWILVLNKNLLLGLSDFRNLRIFLKHNRLQ